MVEQPRKEIAERIAELSYSEAVERATTLSLVLAVLFGVYGITSTDFIQKFAHDVTLLGNLLPRVVCGTIPFLLLRLFLKRSKIPSRKKLAIWVISFSVLFHIAAWIHVWPLTLKGNSNILVYVNSANVYLLTIAYAGISPPLDAIPIFTAIISFLFVLPLIAVAYLSRDPIVFRLVSGDAILAIWLGVVLSVILGRLRVKLFRYEAEKEFEASKFLGPVLSKAIFANESDRLKSTRCRGFIISLDIRDSTRLLQEIGPAWLGFRREYFVAVSQYANQHGGYIQKTIGDCHIVNFGVMDYDPDLSDIPGIEAELARAEERRLQRAGDAAFAFLDAVYCAFEGLVAKHFGRERGIHLGGGIDKGWVERGIQGDISHSLELDVNGDPVNCSNRLQEYSKLLQGSGGTTHSVLVVSPFACDHLHEVASFQRVSTVEKPVRNYPGIKWLLVKRYSPAADLTADSGAA